jgi:hypothetical protein
MSQKGWRKKDKEGKKKKLNQDKIDSS